MSDAMGAPNPLVGVVGGSRSDFPVLDAAVEVLRDLGVACELRVVSAHRPVACGQILVGRRGLPPAR